MLRVKGNGTKNPSHLCQQHALYNAAQLLIWGDKQKHQLRVGWLSDTPDKHSYPDRWLNTANNEMNLFFFFFFFKRDNGSVCFGSSGLHWLVLLKSERQHKIIIIIIIIINIQCVPSVCVCVWVCSLFRQGNFGLTEPGLRFWSVSRPASVSVAESLGSFTSGSCRIPSPCAWCGTVCASACDTVSSWSGSLASEEQRGDNVGLY